MQFCVHIRKTLHLTHILKTLALCTRTYFCSLKLCHIILRDYHGSFCNWHWVKVVVGGDRTQWKSCMYVPQFCIISMRSSCTYIYIHTYIHIEIHSKLLLHLPTVHFYHQWKFDWEVINIYVFLILQSLAYCSKMAKICPAGGQCYKHDFCLFSPIYGVKNQRFSWNPML
jgi:hypothetical protein